jgi:DNA mismatch repair protein MutS2
VDAREGRLGTELGRVRDMFERAREGHLVLLDELCSGTNPSEGQELFQLVLELLGALAPEAYVSTHFLSLIASLGGDGAAPGLAFLQVELDDRSSPTHRVVPGIATTSLARETAARLGITREELLALLARRRSGGGSADDADDQDGSSEPSPSESRLETLRAISSP